MPPRSVFDWKFGKIHHCRVVIQRKHIENTQYIAIGNTENDILYIYICTDKALYLVELARTCKRKIERLYYNLLCQYSNMNSLLRLMFLRLVDFGESPNIWFGIDICIFRLVPSSLVVVVIKLKKITFTRITRPKKMPRKIVECASVAL